MEDMTKNNNTLEYRVCQIEKRLDSLENKVDDRFDSIETKVDKIRTEDIPHIQLVVESLSTRILVLTGVNLTAIIIAILVARFVK